MCGVQQNTLNDLKSFVMFQRMLLTDCTLYAIYQTNAFLKVDKKIDFLYEVTQHKHVALDNKCFSKCNAWLCSGQ